MAPTYWLYACFLEDSFKFICHNAPPEFKDMTGGDLFWIRRHLESELETGIVLGIGLTKYDARAKANEYLAEVGRYDGVEDPTIYQYESTQDMELSQQF